MKHKKKLFGLGIGMAAAIALGSAPAKQVSAAAVGYINITKITYLYNGAGTSTGVVVSNKKKVRLTNYKKVSVIGKKGDWYHIKYTQNKVVYKGYAKKNQVSVLSGQVKTAVYGRINVNSTKIWKSADSSSKTLQSGKKNITLKRTNKVQIVSEKLVKNVKWYKVSFSLSGTAYKGYIKSKNVYLLAEKGLPAIMKTTKSIPLYKKAGKKTVVRSKGKKVSIPKKLELTITGQKLADGKKYIAVKMVYNKKTVKGYVADKNIAFQIVTDENIATATDLSTLSDPQFRAAMLEAGFPSSYIGALAQLHQAYPKWSFSPYITGLDWNTVISKESKVGLNLISNAKSAEWKSKAAGAYNATTGKYIPFDGSTWVTASEAAVRYYMDPRNFLDGRGIFQFESLAYNKISHTQSGVESILKNTPMHNKTFSYLDDVTNTTKSMKYSQAFMVAADTSGVSPYHLASRVKQEVVISPTTMSDSVSGTRSGYTGIYNFYNIGATNTTSGSAVNNGLKWASTGTSYLRPWNSRYRSIVGGAIYIGEKYINVGQNTSYLQKFNVTEKNRYNHQYMSNIEAPNSEATKTASAYSATLNEMTLVFSIPVYTNMPEEVSPIPTK